MYYSVLNEVTQQAKIKY